QRCNVFAEARGPRATAFGIQRAARAQSATARKRRAEPLRATDRGHLRPGTLGKRRGTGYFLRERPALRWTGEVSRPRAHSTALEGVARQDPARKLRPRGCARTVCAGQR